MGSPRSRSARRDWPVFREALREVGLSLGSPEYSELVFEVLRDAKDRLSPEDRYLVTGGREGQDSDLFERTAGRFRALYRSRKNPTMGNDLGIALELMIDALGYKHDLTDARSNDVWSLGSAGYAWRAAEGAGTGHARPQIGEAVAADFEPGSDRPYALMHAASGVLSRGIAVGLESPGGFLYGPAFLQRGLRYAIEWIANPDAEVEPEHQEAAFYFGVALRDVEPWVDGLLREPG